MQLPDYLENGSQVATISDGLHMSLQATLIKEPAVYKLAFRSNKPEAEAFTEWVAEEVLPSIRKTGSYSVPDAQLPESVYQKNLKAHRLRWRDHVLALLLANGQSDKPERTKQFERMYIDVGGNSPTKGDYAINIIARRQVLDELVAEGIIEEGYGRYRLIANTLVEQEAAVKQGILRMYEERAQQPKQLQNSEKKQITQ